MPESVKDACEACFAAHANDCSGFVRAVGTRLGVTITGLANDIVDTIGDSPEWTVLDDGIAAAAQAAAGKLVVGGLRGDEQAHPDEHGHVVVVVAGQPLAQGHTRSPIGAGSAAAGCGIRR